MDTPIEATDLLWALASLCGMRRVPFDARLALQQCPPPTTIATLIPAASALGLQVSQRTIPARDLRHAVLPVLAMRQEASGARLAMVLSADSRTVLVAERGVSPRDVPLRDYADRF